MFSPLGGGSGRRRTRAYLGPVAALLILAALFTALGVWQVKRLAWKEALIARVEAGLAAEPQDAEALPAGLSRRAAAPFEYRKLRASGQFEGEATTLVAATTALGSGYWALTPLRLADGRSVWINRGFVPAGSRRGQIATPVRASLVGLLRLSEPGGSLLRTNRPREDRWYSRDIPAIAARRGVAGSEVGWFLDAGVPGNAPATLPATSPDDDESLAAAPVASAGLATPVPGLTVTHFPNSHLSYAITWFILATLSLGGVGVVIRTSRKPRV